MRFTEDEVLNYVEKQATPAELLILRDLATIRGAMNVLADDAKQRQIITPENVRDLQEAMRLRIGGDVRVEFAVHRIGSEYADREAALRAALDLADLFGVSRERVKASDFKNGRGKPTGTGAVEFVVYNGNGYLSQSIGVTVYYNYPIEEYEEVEVKEEPVDEAD